jgi:hypothetical protein
MLPHVFAIRQLQRLPEHARYFRAMRPNSVCKEKRRRDYLWYANLHVHGLLYQRSVGRTSDLSIERIDLRT